MYRILLIEDDDSLRNQVCEVLEYNDFEVHKVTDFKRVMEEVSLVKPELIILDINLPYMDGNYYCHAIRKKYNVPIIITSARNSDSDQILSMELGSDDYIIKPFNINVLVSRVNACLRRTYGEYTSKSSNSVKGLELDEAGMKLRYRDMAVDLSKNEFRLLRLLIVAPDTVVSREELLEAIWDDKEFVDDNTLTVNVTRIKNKLKSLNLEDVIETKRGVGYILKTEGIK